MDVVTKLLCLLISFYLTFLFAVLILKGLDALSTEASVSLLCFLSSLHICMLPLHTYLWYTKDFIYVYSMCNNMHGLCNGISEGTTTEQCCAYSMVADTQANRLYTHVVKPIFLEGDFVG